MSLLEKSLNIRIHELGINHLDTALSYNNLGGIYELKNNNEKALYFYKKALEIRKKILDENHSDIATSYHNIAGRYKKLGKYEESLKYYQKTLTICEQTLGINHPDTASSYNNLGGLFILTKEYEKAFSYIYNALNIRLKILNPIHSDIASSYNNLATIDAIRGNYQDAYSNLKKCLSIQEKLLPLGKDKYLESKKGLIVLEKLLRKKSIIEEYKCDNETNQKLYNKFMNHASFQEFIKWFFEYKINTNNICQFPNNGFLINRNNIIVDEFYFYKLLLFSFIDVQDKMKILEQISSLSQVQIDKLLNTWEEMIMFFSSIYEVGNIEVEEHWEDSQKGAYSILTFFLR